MKISIVIVAYNEAKNIGQLLSSVERLRYPDSFEVCFVNDGSSDATEKTVKEWHTKHPGISFIYKSLPSNVGRRQAREIGARFASYENLLITDARCELFEDVIENLEKIQYEPIVGNPIQKETGNLSRIFFLLRRKLFSGSIGESFEDIFIDEKNFDSVSKGTTIFFVNRDRFLANQPKESSRYVNEDSGIFASIIKEKKILKTAKVKCFYKQRENLFEEMRHLFHRGPRFVFQYYRFNHRYFFIINLCLAAFLLALLFIIKGFGMDIIGILIVIDIIFSLFFALKIADFFLLLTLGPILAFSFFAGIVEGLFIKLFRLY